MFKYYDKKYDKYLNQIMNVLVCIYIKAYIMKILVCTYTCKRAQQQSLILKTTVYSQKPLGYGKQKVHLYCNSRLWILMLMSRERCEMFLASGRRKRSHRSIVCPGLEGRHKDH